MAARAGAIPFRARRAEGFEALISIVVSQQLSVAAADTIFGRLKAQLGPFVPQKLLAAEEKDLRHCGLSAPKQRHIKSIAAAILEGTLDLRCLRRMQDDDARAHLVAVKGIGPWTADIYLMSALGRADIWPIGDVGLQAATQRALGLKKRPSEQQMERLSKVWRPWRTIAARMLWIHEDRIRREKKLAQAALRAKKRKQR
ncbi:MAG: DNA-3-methyladenine glycosylase 2 family protein [Alphaproteobacteria bacterium]|nr:DNA-3-methyladenine glycosylase 2 family protein [Alphaproteobacteria bacterium]MBV9692512.1 DNA-3-methyladenine glycosylase 2 family protein [Alphaproteobacteria bacterium]